MVCCTRLSDLAHSYSVSLSATGWLPCTVFVCFLRLPHALLLAKQDRQQRQASEAPAADGHVADGDVDACIAAAVEEARAAAETEAEEEMEDLLACLGERCC